MRLVTLFIAALYIFTASAQEDDELDFPDDLPTTSAPAIPDDPTVPPPSAEEPPAEEPVAAPEPPPPPPKPKKVAKKKAIRKKSQKSLFYMAGLTYHMANKISFSKTKITDTGFSESVSTNVGVDPGIGLAVGALWAKPAGWGAMGHFIYEMERSVGTTGGSATIIASNGAKIQFMVFEGNAVYRWDKMFLPFGFNYSLPSYTKGSKDLLSTTINGGLGIQVGCGYILNDKFIFDGGIRMLSMDMTSKGGTTKIAYGLGSLTGFYLRGSYAFF